METFQECAVQMLREFRALLQHSPLPVNQMRLLQLLALNMFAVSNTQLKGRSPLANLSALLLLLLLYQELPAARVVAQRAVGGKVDCLALRSKWPIWAAGGANRNGPTRIKGR